MAFAQGPPQYGGFVVSLPLAVASGLLRDILRRRRAATNPRATDGGCLLHLLSRCQQDRIASSDYDGVLIMRGQSAVLGAECPAIAIQAHAAVSGGNDWLDGDDQTLGQFGARRAIGIVRDSGRFVNGAPYAVSAQLAYDGKARPAHFVFDRAADFADPVARTGGA